MNTKRLLTLMGFLIAGACSSGAPIDREANIAALRETAEAYHAAASAKDAEAVVTFYADKP